MHGDFLQFHHTHELDTNAHLGVVHCVKCRRDAGLEEPCPASRSSISLDIKPQHVAIWQEAETYAATVGTSLSNLVVVALQHRLGHDRRFPPLKLRRGLKPPVVDQESVSGNPTEAS
jgi:hypothetical protein